jgi:hypothetical protein
MGKDMKKVAVFVEGQTEQIFIVELIRNIFGHSNVSFEELQFFGKENSRQIRIIRSVNEECFGKYFFRIYDCHGGGENSTVKSDIIEQFPKLKYEAFSYIIGIRDVYPLPDIAKLKTMLNKNLPVEPEIPVKIFVAVMEIEAWFLAEENHYSKIDESLTIPIVNSMVGFDITIDSTESIKHPSLILNHIYKKVKKSYSKKKWETERTVYNLNYNEPVPKPLNE